MTDPLAAPGARTEERIALLVLFMALLFHAWTMLLGWSSANLPGNEFRQAQTAISAYHIDKDNDFSIAYPTPVLGKPWSIPMEFPLYHWTVVLVKKLTPLTLVQSGRMVSAACFYLTLPAIYMLLGMGRLPRGRRWLALAFILTCPLYTLYTRSFMIETMALMFSVWFLFAYIRAVQLQKPVWLALAVVLGVGAGLVKVTTFMFLLIPAFLWTLWVLWKARPGQPGGGWQPLGRISAFGLGAVLVPCLVSAWWVHYADAVKSMNPAGTFLTSENLRSYNLGTGGRRFSPDLWTYHWYQIFREITPTWVAAFVGVLAVLFARQWWRWIVGALFLFFIVQVIFPELYAWHAYYYMANAFVLMLAFAAVAWGVLDSRLPRSAAWVLIFAVIGGQLWGFFQIQYDSMRGGSMGGSSLTRALRAFTDPEDVIVIAGDDWNSMIPYYSERRALMIPNGREFNPEYMSNAYANLTGERVVALLLREKVRTNQPVIDLAVKTFDLHPKPVFTWESFDVYLERNLRLAAIPIIKGLVNLQDMALTADAIADENAMNSKEIVVNRLPGQSRRFLDNMSPEPEKFFSSFGLGTVDFNGREFFNAHPDLRLWFNLPAGKHVINFEASIVDWAYEEKVPWGDRTDGVEFFVYEELAEGERRMIFSRVLNPRDRPSDRGVVLMTAEFELEQSGSIVLGTGPGPLGSMARDWAMLGKVDVK